MARILTIFGPNKSQRRDLFFEKRSNERRRHRRVVVAAVVAIIVVIAGFSGDSITDPPLLFAQSSEHAFLLATPLPEHPLYINTSILLISTHAILNHIRVIPPLAKTNEKN